MFGIAAVKSDWLPCVWPRRKRCYSHERKKAEPFMTHSCFLSNFSAFVTAGRHSDTGVYMTPLVS